MARAIGVRQGLLLQIAMPFSFLRLSIQPLSVISPTPHHTSASTTHNERSSSVESQHIQISTPTFLERTIPSSACYSTPDILEYHFNNGRNSGTVLLEALEIGFDQIKHLPCSRHISSSSALHSISCSCRDQTKYELPAEQKRNTKTGEENMIMAGWVGRPVRTGCHPGC